MFLVWLHNQTNFLSAPPQAFCMEVFYNPSEIAYRNPYLIFTDRFTDHLL